MCLLPFFFAISGKSVIALSFGEKYMQGASIIAWLGVMQAIRTVRFAPSVISISHAKTKNAMYANIARTIGVALSVLFAVLGYEVKWIAIGGIIGELLALVLSFWLSPVPLSNRTLFRRLTPIFCYFFGICIVADI